MKILHAFGTRPEAIKLAPVILEFKRHKDCQPVTAVTGQQREMLDQVLALFTIKPDHDLDLMIPSQSLEHITTAVLSGMGRILEQERPDMVVIQGDTTTALFAGLAAYYAKIPIGYVESGLRTDDAYRPFPEEMNRRLLSQLATIHFAPTKRAAENLLHDGIRPDRIHVTGNTVIDALKLIAERHLKFKSETLAAIDFTDRRVILLTAHRRESHGRPMEQIFAAVAELAKAHPDILVVFPVHPNPAIKSLAKQRLSGLPNIMLTAPLDYTDLVLLLKRCYLVLTDSGGIQEEAPAFGKPVLVLRDRTERPEGVAAGVAKLVGTDKGRIVAEADRLLDDPKAYRQMAKTANPYGDGQAANRIVEAIIEYLRPIK